MSSVHSNYISNALANGKIFELAREKDQGAMLDDTILILFERLARVCYAQGTHKSVCFETFVRELGINDHRIEVIKIILTNLAIFQCCVFVFTTLIRSLLLSLSLCLLLKCCRLVNLCSCTHIGGIYYFVI